MSWSRKSPPRDKIYKTKKMTRTSEGGGGAFAEFLCVRSNPGDRLFFFFFILPINKPLCCSKGLTSLRSLCSFFLSPRTRYIYREVPLFPAARSSSKGLVRPVSIASSLMRLMSWVFFRSRTERLFSDAHGESQPSFGRTCRPQRESG